MNFRALHLEEGEDVIYEVRKHWIVFLGNVIALFLLASLPLIVFSFAGLFFPELLNIDVHGNIYALFFFFYFLWVLVLWISFFINWTKFYLDVWYVTEKRIIIAEQRQLFDRQVSNIRFDKIQDVSVLIDGFIATFLDFGSVRVQTASEDNTEFSMNMVRHPGEVRKVIFSQHNTISDKKL
ncbi:MAG TPA: PH domain-containing protein [Candidatus Paceibacterota bacterium]